MSGAGIVQPIETRTLTPWAAWRNVLMATVVGWIVIAIPNFGLLTYYLAKSMKNRLLLASLYLDLGFVASCLVVIGLVFLWQRAHGETLANLGWRAPTSKAAIIWSLLFGGLWAATFYAAPGHLSFMAFPFERFVMAPLGVVLAFAEELLFRGFVMEQLRRALVPTWIQVLASAISISSYHGLVGAHYYPTYAIASIFLFGILAILHVYGKRSMTPNTLAHAMAHVFGDPSAIMGILIGASRHLGS